MTPLTLPRLSLAMQEGTLARWLVADGAPVRIGQAVAEIETDKAIVELEAPSEGILRLIVKEGTVVPVESKLAEIDDVSAAGQPTTTTPSPSPARASRAAAVEESADPPAPLGKKGAPDQRKFSSPAARRIARERGLDVTSVRGSGPNGRITSSDLGGIAAPAATPTLRDQVVAQLVASWREIPHIHVGGELDAEGLAVAKRKAPSGITVTDLLVLVLARALTEVPELNVFMGKPSPRVHVSLAIATAGGVISPVIRDVQELSLERISAERIRLVAAARAKRLDKRDLATGTITLSNLGAFPVDHFLPIISGPQVATLATGRLREQPVARGDAVSTRHRIWMNVAIDHRSADGVSGGKLLAALERRMNQLAE
jgi:pyruvate dehydrogenase E2 component (dihydrolipoamide acetyltransferase)